MPYTPQVLTNVRIFSGGYDLTGYSNKIEVAGEFEEKDVTTFLPSADANSGWKKVLGGLGSATVKGGGLWEGTAGAIDEAAWAQLDTVVPVSIYPADAAEGSLGYFTQTLTKSYQFLGAVGDAAPWAIEDDSAWPLVRGVSLEAPGTARSVTGVGTAIQVGAVPTGKFLYAALHVLSVTGTGTPTLTVVVQSDNAVGFPSPVTSISFNAATAIGGQIARVAGPITDDWARISFTISGSGPSFLFVVSAGISV